MILALQIFSNIIRSSRLRYSRKKRGRERERERERKRESYYCRNHREISIDRRKRDHLEKRLRFEIVHDCSYKRFDCAELLSDK